MKIGVTGANGFLGGVICDYLDTLGYDHIKLIRTCVGANTKQFSLTMEYPNDYLAGIDVLIHVAYDFSQIKPEDVYAVNVNGSMKLFELAKRSHVKKVIFISTISAFDGCKSNYGKAKLAIEQSLLEICGGYIIRPALIYGKKLGGVVASLKKIAALPITPFIGGNISLYFSNYADINALLAMLMQNDSGLSFKNNPILAACSRKYTFRGVLQKLGAKIMFPIPWKAVYFMLKVLEYFGLKLRTGSDNLLSLINQNPKLDFSLLKQSGITFHDFTEN